MNYKGHEYCIAQQKQSPHDFYVTEWPSVKYGTLQEAVASCKPVFREAEEVNDCRYSGYRRLRDGEIVQEGDYVDVVGNFGLISVNADHLYATAGSLVSGSRSQIKGVYRTAGVDGYQELTNEDCLLQGDLYLQIGSKKLEVLKHGFGWDVDYAKEYWHGIRFFRKANQKLAEIIKSTNELVEEVFGSIDPPKNEIIPSDEITPMSSAVPNDFEVKASEMVGDFANDMAKLVAHHITDLIDQHLDRDTSSYELFAEDLRDDEDWSWTWHCNLACMLRDAGVPGVESNVRAAQFMKTAFDVDVTKFSMYKDAVDVSSV